MTPPPLLPGSIVVAHDGFDIEMVPDHASADARRLEAVRADVLEVAARSRGWEDPDDIAGFARVFKVGALFRSDALALIWEGGRVVGIMGTSYHEGPDDSLVLHLGSLGLLPHVQRRGFLPTIFSLLLYVVSGRPGAAERYRRDRVYVTAVTQSPYIISLLGVLTTLFPGPGWSRPDPDMVAVAASVLDRFEPEVDFDPATFVLRNECEFTYRTVPYSGDQRLNDYCDARLRYDEGDTFIVVGRARLAAVDWFLHASQETYPDLFATLRTALQADPDLAMVLDSAQKVVG